MKNHFPFTPFSTPLSRSARETELRIRSILAGPKKRPPALFLALVFALCLLCGNLVSCQSTGAAGELDDPEENSAGPLQAVAADSWRDGLEQVLRGQAGFESETGLLLSVDDLTPLFTDTPGLQARAERFAVLDLDGDEEPEAVLQLGMEGNEWAGYLILRWEDGTVRGYFRTLRALQELKADGTFTVSSGAADWGFGSLVFAGGQCREVLDYYCQSTEDGEQYLSRESGYLQDGEPVRYLPIDAELFQWVADQQAGKPGVYWVEPAEENIAAVLAEPNKYHVYHMNVTGERTLTLLCHTTTADQLDPNRYPSPVYRYIQVFDGEELLQTISEDTAVQDEMYLFEGFLPHYGLDVRDVNFDGTMDFGILCGHTYNGPVYWFLWDEENRQFRPGFFSAFDLTVDTENQQLIDCWRDGQVAYYHDIYRFKTPWERELADSKRFDKPTPVK